MSNIVVSHSESGLVTAEVLRSERVTPHVARVTIGGGDVRRLTPLGFDQWVRLAIPAHERTRFDNLPDTFGMRGYLRYRTLPREHRPVIRNYTIRQVRRDPDEVDIDFVVHGEKGIAAPWAATVQPGTPVALIDQGCGWRPVPAEWNLLVADESGLPAVAGILRDLPRDATGHALIELFDADDRQDTGAPDGVTVHWLTRDPADAPGTVALPALADLAFPAGTPYVFAVGERALATGARRHLVGERGVPKSNVTFSGYWRLGHASPS